MIEGRVLSRAPVIDGAIDEMQEWRDAAAFEGLVDESNGTPAAETGRFWIAYDANYIYFAARLADSQPGSIAATEYRTNVSLKGNDSVTLLLDTFGTLSDFNTFSVNPRGATQLSVAGGRAPKLEWLGEFLAKGRITAEGWEAEARIPWKLMRLPSAGGRTLRLNVFRYLQRTQREFAWRYINGGQIEQMGRWVDVQVPRVPLDRTLKLLPYGVLGIEKGSNGSLGLGMDLKTQVTDQVEFVGSLFPDFRNIENQILSLDFSYFERLAGESRPFFLEGGEYFRMGYDQRIFAPQRVRRFDAGAKAYGKLSETSTFGALGTYEAGGQSVFAGSFTKKLGTKTSVGASAVALDGKTANNQAAMVSWGQTFGRLDFYANSMFARDQRVGSGWRNNAGLFYSHEGLEGNVELVEVTPQFFPRAGFSPERDFRGVNAFAEWTRPHPRGTIAETGIEVYGVNYWRTDGRPYRRLVNVGTSLTTRNSIDLDLSAQFGRFERDDDQVFRSSLEMPRRNPYRHWQINYEWGRLRAMRYESLGLGCSYRPLSNWQLNLSGERVRHGGARSQVILSTNYDIGLTEAIGGRLVREGGKVNWYLSYRRSGGRGADYYLIVGDPNAREFESRLVLKAVFPLDISLGRRPKAQASAAS